MDPGESGELRVSVGDHGGGSGQTQRGNVQVTFVFRAGCTCTIGGSTFTSTDLPLTVQATFESVLASIPWSVSAGVLTILELS
jgi:hypothetical protein